MTREFALRPRQPGRLLVFGGVAVAVASAAAVLATAPHHEVGASGTTLSVPAILAAGVLDGFNPCAFGVLILFATFALSFAARESLAAGAGAGDVRRASKTVLGLGSVFVVGVSLTYFALGLGMLTFLSAATDFGANHLPTRVAALVAVALGLWMLRDVLLPEAGFQLAAPAALHGRMRDWVRKTSPVALFTCGVLIGLCTVPCSGAVYLAVVALLTASGTYAAGLGGLVLYNLAYITPLVALLVLASRPRFIRVLNRWHLAHAAGTKLLLATVVLALGFAILISV